MKGKKTDPIFVASFIQESVLSGAETPDQIVARAKEMIVEIDEKIKAVEESKRTRSKLLDVIASFEISKKDRTEDAKLLPFFDLKYPYLCRDICKEFWDKFGDWPFGVPISNSMEYNFCIKQLLEAKVLDRPNGLLGRGERFDEYMRFIET